MKIGIRVWFIRKNRYILQQTRFQRETARGNDREPDRAIVKPPPCRLVLIDRDFIGKWFLLPEKLPLKPKPETDIGKKETYPCHRAPIRLQPAQLQTCQPHAANPPIVNKPRKSTSVRVSL